MTPEPTSPIETRDINELLVQWRELRDEGQPCSPEDLCPGRPDVQEELRKHIAAIEAVESKLLPGLKRTLVTEHIATDAPNLPRTVAGYELLEELGRGGMGVVYKARQRGLNRLVALKMVLAGSHAGREQRLRFRAEAEALARLRHPNIVLVYETGEADGLPFLSLEYVEGGSLDKQIDGRPMPPHEAAVLVESLSRAIAAAHAAGVVHRDLKPANVLMASGVSDDPGSSISPGRSHAPLAKITDFGLAKMVDAEGRTHTGDVLGTPSYMAPEQAAGRIKDVGPAADIYALGAILYECLTGSPPFKGMSTIEVLHQVTTQEPFPPSRLNGKVPRDLETICLKCLEKDAHRRFASADDLADDLKRYLEGLPIMARRVGVFERALKWIKRRPERATLALVLLAVPVIAYAVWPRPKAEPKPSELAERSRVLLVKYCYHCHGLDPNQVAGELSVLDRTQLLDSNRKKRIIVPGDAKASYLIERIEDGSMPPDESEDHPRLSSDEIKELKNWVLAGAPPFHPPQPEDAQVAPVSELAVEVFTLFQNKCRDCHMVGKAGNGIKILNHDLLVEKRKLVLPGKPEDSLLFQTVLNDSVKKKLHAKLVTPLTEKEIDLVRRWIKDGAPTFLLSKPMID